MNDKLREAAHHSLEQWAEDEVLPPQPSVRRGYKRGFRAGYNRALAELTSDEMVEVAAGELVRFLGGDPDDARNGVTARHLMLPEAKAALQAAAKNLGE